MTGARAGLGLIGVVAAVAACQVVLGWHPEEPSLDGWPLGTVIDCGLLERQASLVSRATNQLTAAEREAVVSVSCHREGFYRENGMRAFMSGNGRGVGMATPIVFTFADGSQRAIGVGCGTWSYTSGTNILHSGHCGLRYPLGPSSSE